MITEGFKSGLRCGFGDGNTQRADSTGHETVRSVLLAHMLDALSGDADSGAVDLGDTLVETVAFQAEAVCAEGVGFHDLGSGLEVFQVDGADHVGL